MRIMDAKLKARFQHILDGGCLTSAELRSIEDRFAEINEAIDKCLPSKDLDVLISLDNELRDLLVILETSLENHPDKEIDI